VTVHEWAIVGVVAELVLAIALGTLFDRMGR